MTAAQIAWKQISIPTKMACGAREARQSTESKLVFKVHSKPMRYIEVEYVPGLDLYKVRYFRVKRGRGYREQVTLEECEGVYADMLSDIIYHMVSK